MKTKHNPKEFQVVIDGHPITIDYLTIEQLQQELCGALDMIDHIRDSLSKTSHELYSWMKGS